MAACRGERNHRQLEDSTQFRSRPLVETHIHTYPQVSSDSVTFPFSFALEQTTNSFRERFISDVLAAI